jgi:hypothetical protein
LVQRTVALSVAALQVNVKVICALVTSVVCEPEAPAGPDHEPDFVQVDAFVALQLKFVL